MDQFILTITVEDPDDVTDDTGELVPVAYDRLYEAVTDAGFSVDLVIKARS
jgi:hypothetical protein